VQTLGYRAVPQPQTSGVLRWHAVCTQCNCHQQTCEMTCKPRTWNRVWIGPKLIWYACLTYLGHALSWTSKVGDMRLHASSGMSGSLGCNSIGLPKTGRAQDDGAEPAPRALSPMRKHCETAHANTTALPVPLPAKDNPRAQSHSQAGLRGTNKKQASCPVNSPAPGVILRHLLQKNCTGWSGAAVTYWPPGIG
jgi:hypothetical protein